MVAGLLATVIVLTVGFQAGAFDHELGWIWAAFLVAIYVFNCVWATIAYRRSARQPRSLPPPEASRPSSERIRRWVCGGRIPADIGNLNATWPFVEAELWPGRLLVRVRGLALLSGAFGVPRTMSFEPATTEAVFPSRVLWSSAVGILPRGGRPTYLYIRSGALDELRAAGFPVDTTPRKASFWGL